MPRRRGMIIMWAMKTIKVHAVETAGCFQMSLRDTPKVIPIAADITRTRVTNQIALRRISPSLSNSTPGRDG